MSSCQKHALLSHDFFTLNSLPEGQLTKKAWQSKEMTSCDEAKLYLREYDLSKLDGDSDGVPCVYPEKRSTLA